jgi:hypothetical protein
MKPTMKPVPPTAPPTMAPTPSPAPTRNYEKFIVGDYIAKPKVYNAFSNGQNTSIFGPSYSGRAAIEFPLGGIPFMVEGYAEQYAYTHPGGNGIPQNTDCNAAGLGGNPACVTPIGGGFGSVWVPQFQAIDGDAGARLGVQLANPRIYVAASYVTTSSNYGYPHFHGFGGGLEKLPDLDKTFSLFGSAYYYPQLQGGFTDPTSGTGYEVTYRFLQYQAGVTFSPNPKSGFFLEAGFMGNNISNKNNYPGNGHESGGFGGIGFHF